MKSESTKQIKNFLRNSLSPLNYKRAAIIKRCLSDLKDTFYKSSDIIPRPKTYPIPVQDIKDTLVQMGINRGDVIHVHSSLSHLYRGSPTPVGNININKLIYARKIVQVLLDIVGIEGTVTMNTDSLKPPAGWLQRSVSGKLNSGDIFDYSKDPSRRGLISEVFRTRPDVIRSVYPYYNVTAWGRFAEELIKDHHLSTPYVQDKNSPWYKITQMNGKVVLLGRTFDVNSPIHLVEYLHPEEFPRPVFFSKPVQMLYVDRNKRVCEMEVMLHISGAAAAGGRLFVPGSLFKFSRYLDEKYDLYRIRQFESDVQIVVYDALAQYEAFYSEMKANVTWYDPQFLP